MKNRRYPPQLEAIIGVADQEAQQVIRRLAYLEVRDTLSADETHELNSLRKELDRWPETSRAVADAFFQHIPDWERDLLAKQAAEQKAANAQRAARRGRLGTMPAKFEDLAAYNAERARGLVHTAEWDAAMVLLQCEFSEWAGLT